MKLGMTGIFHLGELIRRPKTKKGANDPMRARGMHRMVIHTWMNPSTEQQFCTSLVTQLCQVLRGYNCVNVGLKLLESEPMDCRGADTDHFVGSDVCDCVDGFDGSNGFDGGFDGSDGGFDGFGGFDGVEGGGPDCSDGFDGLGGSDGT